MTDKLSVKNYKKHTDDWYFIGLPKVKNTEPFGREIVESIVKNVNILLKSNKTSIQFYNADTASTDLKTIFLPVFPLFYSKMAESEYGKNVDLLPASNIEKTSVIVTLYDFYIAHESSHIEYTYIIPRDRIKLFNMIDNILEDYYIDTITSPKFKNIYKLGASLLIGHPQEEKMLDACEQSTTEDRKLDFQNFVESLLQARLTGLYAGEYEYGNKWFNQFILNNSTDDEWFQTLHDDIVEYFSYTDENFSKSRWNNRNRRIDLADRIVNLLKSNCSKEVSEKGLDEKQSEGTDFNTFSKALQKYIEEEFGKIAEVIGKEKLEKLKDELNKEIKKIKEEKENKKVDTKGHGGHKIPNVKVLDVVKFLYRGRKVNLDKRFLPFANKVNYFNSTNFTETPPTKNGMELKEKYFHNYVIDHEIFTNNDSWDKAKNKPQTIILIDGSGSMGDLYKTVLSSAKGLAYSLYTNEFPVSVWVHTGHTFDDDIEYPILVNIFSYKMKDSLGRVVEQIREFNKRFDYASTLPKEQNYDGYVIQEVVKYFTNEGAKNLIVLSDGEPYGNYSYGGHSGIQHTKNVVNKLRTEGIFTVSLSLKSGVVESNNRIYGKKFNFNAIGKNLDKVIQDVCHKMVNLRK